MQETERLLALLAPQIRKGAWRISRSLRLDDDEREDVEQEIVAEFLQETAKGWFDTLPHRNLEAQARHLINICIKRVYQRRALQRMRAHELPGDFEENVEDGNALDPCEVLVDNERRALLLAAAEQLAATRRLTLLGLVFPEVLERRHVEAAARARAGGYRFPRTVDEAWSLFEGARREPHLVHDPTRWKRIVAQIFRMSEEIDRGDEKAILRAVNAMEVQMTNATHTLREILRRGTQP